MKKQLITFIFAALTFGTLMSLNSMAAETETETANSIGVSPSGSIALMAAENLQQEGITALKFSVKVDSPENADVKFNFNQENGAGVTAYRYHKDTGILNIYMADTTPIVSDSDVLVGEVAATDESGNDIDVGISIEENSIQLVANNSVTEKAFTVEEIPDPPEAGKDVRYLEVTRTFPESYLVSIPDSTYDIKQEKNMTISASNVLIGYGEKLKVSVSSGNSWYLMDRNTANKNGVKYHIICADGSAVPDSTNTVLSVNGGEDSGTAELTINLMGKLDVAGTFTDRLTFEIDVS